MEVSNVPTIYLLGDFTAEDELSLLKLNCKVNIARELPLEEGTNLVISKDLHFLQSLRVNYTIWLNPTFLPHMNPTDFAKFPKFAKPHKIISSLC